MFLLVGWAQKTVRLLDNKRLIDLDSMISEAPLGQQGSGGNDGTVSGNLTEEENDSQQNNKKTFEVVVQGDKITYRGDSYLVASGDDDPALLQYMITKDLATNPGIRIHLIDDWAEAHTYRKVDNILMELEESYDFIFDMD